MSQVEQFYTVQEVAKRLAVSVSQVRREIELGKRTQGDSGLWPTHKFGHKMVRIPASAVNKWLGGNRI